MLSRLDAPGCAALLFAFAFATTLALLRPPFQLSDEVYYFATAQPVDLAGKASAACRPMTTRVMPVGFERRLFKGVVTPLLFHGCEITQSPAAAFHLARVVLGLGLVIVAWATWQAARLLAPSSPEVAGLAATMVASQPVLATMSAGITPSALADPLAAIGCLGVVGAATATDWRRFVWLAIAVGACVAGLLAKDTMMGLLVLTVVGGPMVVRRSGPRRSIVWRRIVKMALPALWIAVVLAVAGGVLTMEGGPLQRFRLALTLDGAVDRALSSGVLFRTLSSIPAYYWSFIGSLGNFGGNLVHLPTTIGLMVLALAGISSGGLLLTRQAGGRVERRSWRHLTVFFGVLIVALLFQAPVQDAMVGQAPALQGRWLFPGILPLTLWPCLGLLAWTSRPGRLVPLLAILIATVPCVALFWVIVPHFYAAFPHTYNFQGLFLRGPYGVPIDQALLAPFLGPPGWLADMRVAWLLLLATLSSAVWMVVATTRQTDVGPSAR